MVIISIERKSDGSVIVTGYIITSFTLLLGRYFFIMILFIFDCITSIQQ